MNSGSNTAAARLARDFRGRVVMLGYGTIGQCLLPMLQSDLDLAPERFTVVDGEDRTADFTPRGTAGVGYQVLRFEPENLEPLLASLAVPGDLLINVSVGIDSIAVASWCHRNGVTYVDSSIEPWIEEIWDDSLPPHRVTEYHFHQRARNCAWEAKGPTAVVCHGANPGLVSHFVKAALLEIAAAAGLDERPESRGDWARLAQRTGTRVIHISERDTQIASRPKRPEEFVNTWSILGFVEEARMPMEVGWGTHERELPDGAQSHGAGPRNAIYVPQPSGRMMLRSWVPRGRQINGLALPHSESITISDYLTLRENSHTVYRPTVAFAYLPCDGAMASLHETMMRDWSIPDRQRVLNDEIIDGMDELGVLLLGHRLGGWWFGSQLDIGEARRVAPGNNPTAVQVAAGVLAASAWVMAHPTEGYCEPEDLPHELVLDIARPYLGKLVSRRTDWNPLQERRSPFDEPWLDLDDPWQFTNFLVRT